MTRDKPTEFFTPFTRFNSLSPSDNQIAFELQGASISEQQLRKAVLRQFNQEHNQIWVDAEIPFGAIGSQTLYLVPTNKILYVTNVFYTVVCNGTGVGTDIEADLLIENVSGKSFFKIHMLSNQFWIETGSSAFSMPIRINSKEKIILYTSSSEFHIVCSLQGWVEDASTV